MGCAVSDENYPNPNRKIYEGDCSTKAKAYSSEKIQTEFAFSSCDLYLNDARGALKKCNDEDWTFSYMEGTRFLPFIALVNIDALFDESDFKRFSLKCEDYFSLLSTRFKKSLFIMHCIVSGKVSYYYVDSDNAKTKSDRIKQFYNSFLTIDRDVRDEIKFLFYARFVVSVMMFITDKTIDTSDKERFHNLIYSLINIEGSQFSIKLYELRSVGDILRKTID